MCGGDQIQVMAVFLLQIEHHISQSLWTHAVSQTALAQGEVLAIGAAGLAVAEKDRPRAVGATDRWLFAAMDIPGGHDSLGFRVADACFAGDPISAAVLWTDRATAQHLPHALFAFC